MKAPELTEDQTELDFEESYSKEPDWNENVSDVSEKAGINEVGQKEADLKATDQKEVGQRKPGHSRAGEIERNSRLAGQDKGGHLIPCKEISGPPVVPQRIVTQTNGGRKIASRIDSNQDALSDENSSDEIDIYGGPSDATKYIKPHVTLRDRLERYHAPQKYI
jgi:hypothetical protein